MKIIALVTLVVGNKEYLPKSTVDIQNDKEAKSLISRGFASAFKKNAAPEAKKEDGKTSESPKNDDEDITQDNENDGSTVQESGGQPV